MEPGQNTIILARSSHEPGPQDCARVNIEVIGIDEKSTHQRRAPLIHALLLVEVGEAAFPV